MPGARRGTADGRVLRGRRNKEAVVQGLLSLVADGDLNPTAKAIAERAGLSRRSVFQHFADVETIYQAATARVGTSVEPLLAPVDPTLAVPARLQALVGLRRELFAVLDPFARAARLREPFSVELRASRQRLTRRMVDQCREAFAAEAAAAGPDGRDPLVVGVAGALSWSLWDHLTMDVGVSRELAIATMAGLAGGVLGLRSVPLTGASAGG